MTKMREKQSNGDYFLNFNKPFHPLQIFELLSISSVGLSAKSRVPNLYFKRVLNYIILHSCCHFAFPGPPPLLVKSWYCSSAASQPNLDFFCIECYTEVKEDPQG